MQSVWRDIAVVLDASPAGESVGRHAVDLAKRHQAHLVGIYGLSLQHYLPEDFVQGASAIRHVSERRRESEERKIWSPAGALPWRAGARPSCFPGSCGA